MLEMKVEIKVGVKENVEMATRELDSLAKTIILVAVHS